MAAGWMPAASVVCQKKLGRDDIVPDWGTVQVHPSGDQCYTREDWEVSSILAVWNLSEVGSDVKEFVSREWPSEMWVRVPAGRVPVDLRHTTWNGR